MEKELKLKKVSAYEVIVSTDERSSKTLGYYKDSNIASIDSKKAGWYDLDGEVSSVELYEDENGDIYDVESLGKYKDVEKEYREEILAKIRSKLTTEELKFLNL